MQGRCCRGSNGTDPLDKTDFKRYVVETVITTQQSSSSLSPKCIAAITTTTLPLLLLLPIGLATQMDIPGMEGVKARVSEQINSINRQITSSNDRLQREIGAYNGPLASQAREFNAMLRDNGELVGQIAGGIAMAAAGILAVSWAVNACVGEESATSSFDTSSGSSADEPAPTTTAAAPTTTAAPKA